jgi:hypothetical protein
VKKWGVLAGALCLLILAGLWFWRFQITEEERVQISDTVYSSGETVPFGENFFWSDSENANGYTITVDSSQVRNVREFLEENGSSWEEVYTEIGNTLSPSEVVYLVTTTVTNESNEDGMVQFGNFMMTSGSILLQLDSTLNNFSAPELANAGSFVLPVGKSRTFTFAFTPDSATVAADSKTLYRRMETGEFFLCISQVPERCLIAIPQKTE